MSVHYLDYQTSDTLSLPSNELCTTSDTNAFLLFINLEEVSLFNSISSLLQIWLSFYYFHHLRCFTYVSQLVRYPPVTMSS